MMIAIIYYSYHLRIIYEINFIITHTIKNVTENSLVENIRNIENIYLHRTIKYKFM